MKNITANHIQHHKVHIKPFIVKNIKICIALRALPPCSQLFPISLHSFVSRDPIQHSTFMKLAKCYKQKLDGTRETCAIPVAFISILLQTQTPHTHTKWHTYACITKHACIPFFRLKLKLQTCTSSRIVSNIIIKCVQ